MSNVENIIISLAHAAKKASYKLAALKSTQKNQALEAMAQALERNRAFILAQNAIDINLAEEKALSQAIIDRLRLNSERIDEIIAGIRAIAKLSDPIGKLITSQIMSNNIELRKIRVPIGVIGVIFEARPNVVVDVAALCLKSGNAVILRGGSECDYSNRALFSALLEGLERVDFTPHAIQIIPVKDRSAVNILCTLNNYVDLIIPRGGESLIKAVVDAATVPVIKHYKGLCHIYIDHSADISMALNICHNAKCQRPGVCNAVETILIHEKIAPSFLPALVTLFREHHVEIRACERSRELILELKPATQEDWETEYLDLIIAIKIVSSLEEAIDHINTYGSHHSDAIISEDKASQHQFAVQIDSAAVYINASTRFTDGGQFGLGAEIGISTDKLHARGPMGLNELTTYKYLALGCGQIR